MDLTTTTKEQLEQQYNSSSPENSELQSLITHIADTGQLRFTNEELKSTYPDLLDKEYFGEDGFSVAGKNFTVRKTPIFFYTLYRNFSKVLGCNLDTGINGILTFVDNVTDALHGKGTIYGLSHLTEGLTELLLHITSTETNAAVYDYALRLNLADYQQSTENFWHILIATWPNWRFSTDQTWAICRHWTIGMSTAPDNRRDSDIGLIGKFIRNYACSTRADTPCLKQLAIDDLSTAGLDELVVAALIGLSECGHLTPKEWLPWLDRPETRKRALILAANVNISAEEKVAVLDKVMDTPFLAEEAFFLPQFYESILTSLPPDETEIRARCQHQLESFLQSTDPKLVQATILVAARIDDDPGKWTEHFIQLIHEGKYSESLTPPINGFFSRRKNFEGFKTFLEAYAEWKGRGSDYKAFMASVLTLARDDRPTLEKIILEMIIHDRGAIRWAGQTLFYDIVQANRPTPLSFDILSFDPLSQYKLAVYLLHPFRQPDNTIPFAYPLLNSPEEAVRSVTRYKLLELVYHFRDEVVSQLDKSLPADFPERNTIIADLKTTVEELRAETQFRVAINELNPQLNQSRLYRSYWTAYRKRTREQLSQAQQSPGSLFSLAHKISVPRGGGWRPNSTAPVQQLKTVSVSWSFSRLFTILPEKMELEYQRVFLEDQPKDAFDGWQKIPF